MRVLSCLRALEGGGGGASSEGIQFSTLVSGYFIISRIPPLASPISITSTGIDLTAKRYMHNNNNKNSKSLLKETFWSVVSQFDYMDMGDMCTHIHVHAHAHVHAHVGGWKADCAEQSGAALLLCATRDANERTFSFDFC